MKNLPLFCLLLIYSCSYKFAPLRGNYPDRPFISFTTKPVDYVWNKIIELSSQNGLPIKIVDKSSGLIVFEKCRLSFTCEDKNGKLLNRAAFIVVPAAYDDDDDTYILEGGPEDISGDINIHIQSIQSGTQVNVNIVNLSYTHFSTEYHSRVTDNLNNGYRSTGVFEGIVAEYVK